MDIKQEQISKLKQLFPEVFTEGDKIDWEKLKTTLGENIDVGKERFGLSWAGKSNCFKLIQQPSTGTLIPAKEESVNFDTTENLFIEGDNLEVLKLLQKAYFGKVKMIYIDPPYNTGNDFVYTDDFKDNLKNYLEITGQVDSEGRRLTTNVESDGRFHSNWLNMMYPRLFLARNLLREDGVLYISIDDNEVQNLISVCKEIFGEENFIGEIIRKKKSTSNDSDNGFNSQHDYCLVVAKNIELCVLRGEGKDFSGYSNPDNDPKGQWTSGDPTAIDDGRKSKFIDPIINPFTGRTDNPGIGKRWRFNQQGLERMIAEGKIVFKKDYKADERGFIFKRYKLELEDDRKLVTSLFVDNKFLNQAATKELANIFGEKFFDFPKPMAFINRLIYYTTLSDTSEIILDFFSGTCTTAHAVLELNLEQGSDRRFICVQIPEPTGETSEAFKAGYKTIADIGKERIRRVINKIKEEDQKREPGLFSEDSKPLDLGFKVFKLQPSNFSTWDPNVEKSVDALTEQLFRHVDHLSPEAAQDAILYELLLKAGFELTTEITKLTLADKTVFSIMDYTMLICLERNLTNELLKAIAELKPKQFICLDEGFRDNDQLKSNAVLLMKQNGVQKFQTV